MSESFASLSKAREHAKLGPAPGPGPHSSYSAGHLPRPSPSRPRSRHMSSATWRCTAQDLLPRCVGGWHQDAQVLRPMRTQWLRSAFLFPEKKRKKEEEGSLGCVCFSSAFLDRAVLQRSQALRRRSAAAPQGVLGLSWPALLASRRVSFRIWAWNLRASRALQAITP